MNELKPVGKDEVVPLINKQEEELEKLVKKINATLLKEYGQNGCYIIVNVEKTPHRKIINKIKKMYDEDLGNKGWKVEFENLDQRREGNFFRFTPKWRDD